MTPTTPRLLGILRQMAIVTTLFMFASQSDRAASATQDKSLERSFLVDQSNSDDPVKIVGFTVNGSLIDTIRDFKTEGDIVYPVASVRATDEA
jgi:hypothetical protein